MLQGNTDHCCIFVEWDFVAKGLKHFYYFGLKLYSSEEIKVIEALKCIHIKNKRGDVDSITTVLLDLEPNVIITYSF